MPRDLRLLAAAVFLSAAGDLLAAITLALEVHALSGSGIAVAALFGALFGPAVLLAPLAGLIADRFESVRVMVVASLAQAVVAVALAFAGDVGSILVLAALLAAGTTISAPAEFALVPRVAGAGRLARANGVVESARYAGFAVGPLLAGLLAAGAGARVALLVNAASFLAVAGAGAAMRTRRPRPAVAEAGAPDRARDGFLHLWTDPVLRATVSAAVGALALISASITVEVFYVKDVLHAGDAAYALITAVWMAGMVAGAAGIAERVPQRALATGALVALGVQGAGMGLQTVWTILPIAFLGYAVGGVGHGVKNTLIRTLIQRRVPESLHGRAAAAYNAARNTAELAALAAGGVLVAAVGPRAVLAGAGLGAVLAALAGLAALRTRRAPERYIIPRPPLTPIVSPVTNEASSEAR